jgi:hypothetical protein
LIYRANGYIYGVSNKPIDEESKKIYEIINTKPKAESGYDYRLKEDLTWELFKFPESRETETEATEADLKAQAYDILMGVE